jgi:hypothetical protein
MMTNDGATRELRTDVTVLRKLLLLTLPTLLVCFVLAELVFRFIVPAAELPNAIHDRGLMKFDTRGPRSGMFTVGPFAEPGGRWRINDEGWNSAVEYSRRPRRPLIAVIGDSFVEAFHVDPDKTFGALIRHQLEGKGDVYTFGFSGTPLTGYLEIARYVRREFHPEVLIVNVVHNDFDESVRSLKPGSNFLQFDRRAGAIVEIPAAPYQSSAVRRLLRHSAVARYIIINCKLSRNMARLSPAGQNVAARLLRNRPVIEPVVEAVFAKLAAENPDTTIVIVLDGPRQHMFADAESQAQLRWLPEMMSRLSRSHGFEFIDLGPRLSSFTERSGRPVSFETDYHWNDDGHRVAASAVLEVLRTRGLAPAGNGAAR